MDRTTTQEHPTTYKSLEPTPDKKSYLSGVLLPISLAETSPLAEGLVVTNLEHWDGVFSGKSLDELDVVSFVAVLGQEARGNVKM